MALKGLRVVEMAGLAPVPLAGMILAGEFTVILKTGQEIMPGFS